MKKITSYRPGRRVAQLATLLVIALIPLTGLLRVDLTTASFTLLGQPVWWSSFTLVTGLTLVLVTAPILTYMTIGSVWCGWACPQNLLSEWANNLTFKLLGKRASVEVVGEGMKVAAAKNKLMNWLILGGSFLLVSLLLAMIPLAFFYPPGEVLEIVTLRHAEQLSPFVIYLFMTLLIFVDIAVARYFVCDYACVYRMGQRMFKTQDALHVSYDATRSSDCSKCNYCATSCITKIEPTDIKQYDSCINCGECIDACDRLHEKTGTTGLLTFQFKAQRNPVTWYQKMASVLSQAHWLVVAIFLIGIAMVVWGIITQPKVVAEVPFAVQQKNREVGRVCTAQCAAQQGACKDHNMESCYRAAACKCDCYLQQDPLNAAHADWQQCVDRNTAHAETEHSKAAARLAKP